MPWIPDGRSQLGAQEAKQGLLTIASRDFSRSHHLQQTQLKGKWEIITPGEASPLPERCVPWLPLGGLSQASCLVPGFAPMNLEGHKSPCRRLPQVNTRKELLVKTYRAAQGLPSWSHQMLTSCSSGASAGSGPFSRFPK